MYDFEGHTRTGEVNERFKREKEKHPGRSNKIVKVPVKENL